MLKQLLLPPANLILLALALVGLARLLRLSWRWPVGVTAAVAYVIATPLAGETLLSWHQSYPPLQAAELRADAEAPGAVIVLGAGLRSRIDAPGQPRLDALSLTRTLYAAEVAERTGRPILTAGGPWGEIPTPLADLMARTLARHSTAEVGWRERRSRNTRENARNSARILREAGITRAYLVTHAWHMPRAVAAFRGRGVAIVPAPTGFAQTPEPTGRALLPTPDGLQASYYAIYELLGRIAYAVGAR